MLTQEQIQFLNNTNWTETNSAVSVNGNIFINELNLTRIPITFDSCTGKFDCQQNRLTTLKGAPNTTNIFDCDQNQLSSLEGGPQIITGGYYSCSNNKLTNLIGAPNVCPGTFWCDSNQLTRLEGCPLVIEGNFRCYNNPNLKYLWGIGRVQGLVFYDNANVINEWIITCARRNVIFPYYTLEENLKWLLNEEKYSCLFTAPQEILQHVSEYIQLLHKFNLLI